MIKTSEQIENKIDGLIVEEQIKIDKFLSEINSTIVEIRQSEDKKYSLLSAIFNCFYENKILSIPKQTIFDYILQDVIKYKGKMIVSFVLNGTNSMEIINENNYFKKTNSILSRNKCLIMEGNQISIDINFIQIHRNLMYRNLFGKEGKLFISAHKKIKKLKTLKVNQNQDPGRKDNSKDNPIDENNEIDDYEIEIVDSEQDNSNSKQLNKQNKKLSNDFNPKSDSNSTNFTNVTKISDLDNINKIDISISPKKNEKKIYLGKKRKIKKINRNKENYNKIINNIISRDIKNNNNKNGDDKSDDISILNLIEDETSKEKKEEIKAEKEILSLIEEGKIFLSLFKDKKLLNEFESQINSTNNNSNNDNENDTYIKSILLNYCNDNTIKNNLNVLNNDYVLFQNSLKKLIDYKSNFNDSNSSTFFSKFSIMNKIIVGKERCNLLIDKIIMKLKQLTLEYGFIKKVVNNFDNNKTESFMKFKDIMTNNKKQENDNYVNDLKMQLKDELNKALLINKEENNKDSINSINI